jgi:aspartyl protease family protein
MVDTGAFAIAMNQVEADRLGIDWRNGKRFMAGTAGGGTPGYEIVLDTVTVGAITLHSIKAAVIVADTDTDILLGMSFLSQTEMREENNALILRKKF